MSFNEAVIRDSLAKNLQLLEAGLRIDKKEKFIPNKYGTRSFIDLVAHDQDGRIVLIEVKKTKAAEREAIHEILKYIEGTKRHLRLREDEIRVFVVSPEWTELLIPFSSFVQRTTSHVVGFKLHLSPEGEVTAADLVQPVELFGERFIAPWHELRYYSERKNCSEAIEEYEIACQTKGIESYILLELHPSAGHEEGISSPKQGTMRDTIAMIAGAEPLDASLRLYKRALYFAMQELSEPEYASILKNSPQDTSETFEYLEDMEDEEERLLTLHEAVLDLKPRASADFLEIAYPAKLASRLLVEDGWEIGRIHRYGAFERNSQILTDEQVVKEICGEEGSSYQKYAKSFNPSNKPQVAEVLKGVERCLSENPAWRKQIAEVLREVVALGDTDEVEINLFYPSTGLLTFYLAASRGEHEQYVPSYTISRKVGGKTVLVFGCLVGIARLLL